METTGTSLPTCKEEDEEEDTPMEISVLEAQRMVVLKELKQTLAKHYTGNHVVVESISCGPTTTSITATTTTTATEVAKPEQQQQQQAAVEQQNKQVVMNDLTKWVSGIYTNHHHVVESSNSSSNSSLQEEVDDTLDEEEVEDYDQQGVLTVSKHKTEEEEEEEVVVESPVKSLPLQQEQEHLPVFSTPVQKAPITTPSKDLPRSHHYYFQTTPSKQQQLPLPPPQEEDDRSVFTEVTIDEIVQHMVPVLPESSQKTRDFKYQMRKSFLAFEQLVKAKEDNYEDADDGDDEYDEETVMEDRNKKNNKHDCLDDNKSVMTEWTVDELVEQATTTAQSNHHHPPPPKLQAFQEEMRKSFQVFEALLGEEEEEEEEEGVADESKLHSNSSFEEITVADESLVPQQRTRQDSYDEYTIEGDQTFLEEDEEDDNPSALEANHSYDEITVDETVLAEQPSAAAKSSSGSNNKGQLKQERVKQFQDERKKSFSVFESIVLKQQKEEEDEDDNKSCMTEYTVEEIVKQVIPKGNDSKSFAREMRQSFLAFESLLKQNEEEESVWDEQTIQESAAPSSTPAAAKMNAAPTPAVEQTTKPQPQQDSASVSSTPVSIKSGKNYEDAISLVGSVASGSGINYSDAISLVDSRQESSAMKAEAGAPFHHSHQSVDGDEKEEAASTDSPDNLLKQTQRFITTIGGMVSFDKGDSTDHTEQETLSGETQLKEDELAVHQVISPIRREEVEVYNALPTAVPKTTQRQKDGPMLIFNPLGDLLPPTPPPFQAQAAHDRVTPSKINVLLNSRMFSDQGLVLPAEENKPEHTTPQRNMPVMNVEFDDGGYDDDDDMTQLTFDHSFHESPIKLPVAPKDEESSAKGDDNVSTCSSQASKGIADLLRRDIWSPDLATVKGALEKLGSEASKGASYRSYIVKFGGLLGILRAMDMNQNHAGIQVAACMTLEQMALDPDTQMSIGEVGGIPVISNVMQHNMGLVQIQRAASAALVNISCCPQEEIDGALEAIILSMTKHANDSEVQENSFKALANLTMDSPARLKELSNRGGLAAMTMALQKPWSNRAEHHEAISLLSMLLRNLAECSQ